MLCVPMEELEPLLSPSDAHAQNNSDDNNKNNNTARMLLHSLAVSRIAVCVLLTLCVLAWKLICVLTHT